VSEPQTEAGRDAAEIDHAAAWASRNLNDSHMNHSSLPTAECGGCGRIREWQRQAVAAWLDTEAEGLLAEALHAQGEAFIAEPESFDSRAAIAAFLVSHLRERMTP
jgi:hypothetical protein